MMKTTVLVLAMLIVFGAGFLAATAVNPANAAPRFGDDPDTDVTVMQWNEESYTGTIIIVRGNKMYIAQYPGADIERPAELKPWAILRK